MLHQADGPTVMGIVAIEVAKERACVTYCDHDRRNRRRELLPGIRPPARMPAISAVSA
jgi:hypothetical protein